MYITKTIKIDVKYVYIIKCAEVCRAWIPIDTLDNWELFPHLPQELTFISEPHSIKWQIAGRDFCPDRKKVNLLFIFHLSYYQYSQSRHCEQWSVSGYCVG